MKAIPLDWIKKYIDQLLEGAKTLGADTAMGKACVLRAEHAMDLVQAWQESHK